MFVLLCESSRVGVFMLPFILCIHLAIVSSNKITPKDVALFDRIKQAINCRLAVTDVMRLHGPTKITVGDLWTLIPPSEQTLWEEKRVQESVPDYTPGWLTSILEPVATTGEKFNKYQYL